MASLVFYDIRHVLDIFPNRSAFTCVGTTIQGRRCRQSKISRSDLAKADIKLNTINQLDIYDPRFLILIEPLLQQLADLTLCPRWHRDDRYGRSQRDQTVAQWLTTVETYRNQIFLPYPSSSSRSRSHRAIFATIPAHSLTHSVTSTTSRTSSSSSRDRTPTASTYSSSSRHSTPSHSTSSSSSSPSSPSSTFSAGHDSGYSTSHSTLSSSSGSALSSPFQGPSAVFHSPPSSIWSMEPPSAASSDSDFEASSSRRSSRSSDRSHRSSSQQQQGAMPPEETGVGSLAASLATSLTPFILEQLTAAITAALTTPQANSPLAAALQTALSAALTMPPAHSSPSASSNDTRVEAPDDSTSASESSPSRSTPLVNRRPLVECYTCYEPIMHAADAVWCRTCGHNTHILCFQRWTATQIDQGRQVTCGFCRAAWT